MNYRLNLALCVLALLAVPGIYAAQHVVEVAMPRGGTRGTTVEVKLYGKYVQDPQEVVFYRPGIRCTKVSLPPEDEKTKKVPEGYVVATFEIAKDCPLGEHLLRLRTNRFLAEPVTFWVGPFPTVLEAEKKTGENDTPDKGQEVELNSTIAGEIHGGESMDHDCYRFKAKKGQPISVEVEAGRLGTTHAGAGNDVAIIVTGPSNELIARCDDSALLVQDPMVSFKAPADGVYTLDVSQQMYSSPQRAHYRVHLGTFPRPTAVFPAGGKAGEPVPVTVLGDASGAFKQTVTLPQKTGTFEFFPVQENESPPSPLLMRVSSFSNILEAEPNNDFAQAKVVTLPIALNGIIEKEGDADLYKFKAEKGENWRIRVFARALGTPLDSRVWIRSAKPGAETEKPLQEADDSLLGERDLWSVSGGSQIKDRLDPAFIFRPRESGEYILGIDDTRGEGGADFVYRIEIDQQRDGYFPYVFGERSEKRPRDVGFVVPQGGRWTVNVKLGAAIGSSYKGDIELVAEDLPKGVTMIAPKLTSALRDQRGGAIPVQFVAEPNVEPQTKFFRILAKPVEAKDSFDSGCQQGFAYTDGRGQYGWWRQTFVDKFALGIVNPAPYSIELSQPATALARSGELVLIAKLKRQEGFTGAVEIQTDWVPPGIEKSSPQTIGANETEATIRLRAQAKALLGTFKLAVIGITTDGEVATGAGCRMVSSAFVDLTVTEPYVGVVLKRTSIERGQNGTMVAEVTHNKPFPGKATAALKNLPYGVTVVEPLPELTSNDKDVTFNLKASNDALVGQYKEISCEISIVDNGQTIRQQTGSGVIRIDPVRGAGAANK